MKNVFGRQVLGEEGRDVGPDTYPVRRFSLPVDQDLVRKNGTVLPTDVVEPEVRFEIPRNYLQRNDLMILNIIAANKWQRPIYFTSPIDELGFIEYLRKDGMSYRLVPVKSTNMSNNWLINTYQRDINPTAMYDNVMNKFVFESRKGAYFDEENRRHVLSIRNAYAEAAGNLADAGKKDEAIKVLEKCDQLINNDVLPYAMVSRGNSHNINTLSYLEAAYKAGKLDLANKLKAALKKDFEQQKAYFDYLRTNREDLFGQYDGQNGEAARNEYFMSLLDALEKRYVPTAAAPGNIEGQKTIETGVAPDTIKKDSGR